jgi:hypothetical protein
MARRSRCEASGRSQSAGDHLIGRTTWAFPELMNHAVIHLRSLMGKILIDGFAVLFYYGIHYSLCLDLIIPVWIGSFNWATRTL